MKGRIMEIVYHFDTASEALRACENGELVTGSVIVVASDCIVGLAGNPPRAITARTGPFKPFFTTARSAILAEGDHTAPQIRTAVDEACRQGFPVPEALGDFATLRSEMSACAREYRLTSDEVLALAEACDARSAEFRSTLSRAGAESTAARILRAGIDNLSAARRKLLDRPL